MALYRATIYKEADIGGMERWSNVYTLNEVDPNAALDTAEIIAGHEMQVSYDTARAFRISVSPAPGTTPGGATRNIDIPGVQTPADLNMALPGWNTVLVRFTNAGGRPELKYLRLPLYEEDIEGRFLIAGTLSLVSLSYAAMVLGIPSYVGPNGEGHVTADVESRVQMRQTDWHRRSRPGFVRGWVPV